VRFSVDWRLDTGFYEGSPRDGYADNFVSGFLNLGLPAGSTARLAWISGIPLRCRLSASGHKPAISVSKHDRHRQRSAYAIHCYFYQNPSQTCIVKITVSNCATAR